MRSRRLTNRVQPRATETGMPYIGSSRNKYAPYLVTHFNRTEIFTPGDPVGPWYPGGVFEIDPNWIYGLWRMQTRDPGGSAYITSGEGNGWMQSTTSPPQASGSDARTPIVSNGLFNNKLSLLSVNGDVARLRLRSFESFPYTGKRLDVMLKNSDETAITVEYFFRITSIAPTALQIGIFSVGDHVWYNANPARLLLNVEPTLSGSWSKLRLFIGISSSHTGNYISNSQITYTTEIPTDLSDGGWHHFAFVKYGIQNIKIFIDGKSCFSQRDFASDENWSNANQPQPYVYTMGPQPDPGNNGQSMYQCDMDTIRIVTAALYTRNFVNPVFLPDLTINSV